MLWYYMVVRVQLHALAAFAYLANKPEYQSSRGLGVSQSRSGCYNLAPAMNRIPSSPYRNPFM